MFLEMQILLSEFVVMIKGTVMFLCNVHVLIIVRKHSSWDYYQ